MLLRGCYLAPYGKSIVDNAQACKLPLVTAVDFTPRARKSDEGRAEMALQVGGLFS